MLSSTVTNKKESENILSDRLQLISNWTFNWKMLFNPDPSKPAREVLFSSLNNVQVERSSYQKLGTILEKLNFKQHIDDPISISNKDISVIKKLRHIFTL